MPKTKQTLSLLVKKHQLLNENMDLKKYFTQTKSYSILENALYYGIISHADQTALEKIVCTDALCFFLVSNGKANIYFHHTPEQNCNIEKNDLIVSLPSTTVNIQNISSDYAMYVLMLTPAFFYSLQASQYLHEKVYEYYTKDAFRPLHLTNKTSDYLKKSMTLFRGQSDRETPHKEGVYSHLCNFFMLNAGDLFFSSMTDAFPAVSNRSSLCHKFKELLFKHYRKQHKLPFYAERLSISTIYLSRIIKEETGQTVYGHITELLYSDAKKMLSCSKHDIQKISCVLGFTDQASFSKFFKRLAGISPKDYRNNIRKNETD